MAAESKIEWTDATWNPITGCSVISAGCKNCYAMKLAGTRLRRHPSREGLTRDSAAGPVWTGEVRFNAQWLQQPLTWGRARMVFVCAHGDLFHESVPDEWIDKVFAVMALAEWHTFQVLTKRATRMREYFEHPLREALIGREIGRLQLERTAMRVVTWSGLPLPNVWLGISAENQKHADERIPHLLSTPASLHFLSAEPLLGSIDSLIVQSLRGGKLGWVIAGGESGLNARPMHPDWARGLRDRCRAAGVPFFFKQWGEWIEPDIDGLPVRLLAHEGDPEFFAAGATMDGFLCADGRFASSIDELEPEVRYLGMRRIGKKNAGRLLDGREWNEVPPTRA